MRKLSKKEQNLRFQRLNRLMDAIMAGRQKGKLFNTLYPPLKPQ